MMLLQDGHGLVEIFVFLWIVSITASCSLMDERIDRAADGPNVAADTTIEASTTAATSAAVSAAPEMQAASGPLNITITEAILLCLENNPALAVQRLAPAIRQIQEDRERAAFDPTVAASISTDKVDGQRLARSGSATENFTTNDVQGGISLTQYFPTGTTVSLESDIQMEDSSLYRDSFYSSRLGMTVTQALLKGFGTDVNLAQLRQARLETRISEYELRGFTDLLVAELEHTYWDYALAKRQIEIVEESLRVAHRQLDETQALIAVGRLPRAELSAVQAEVASQEQARIEARANEETIRLQLLRLLNPGGPDVWQREIHLIHQPTLPDIDLEDVALHVALARRNQPLLNEARLRIRHGDLELVKTRNGLLPALDFFVTLGKSGYASSFGESLGNITKDSYDARAGIRFNYPVFNRESNALHRRAMLTHEQAKKALTNLYQLAEVDVRTAYIEVNRTHQQIAASSATRRFDEEKLRTETEKLRVGKSTSFLVAQAQRDLLASRIAEVRSLVNYLKALTDLYRNDGSLLERRGISAPGNETVRLSN